MQVWLWLCGLAHGGSLGVRGEWADELLCVGCVGADLCVRVVESTNQDRDTSEESALYILLNSYSEARNTRSTNPERQLKPHLGSSVETTTKD
jgi:hypothetical protein